MTERDYVLIAGVIAHCVDHTSPNTTGRQAVSNVARRMADALERDNPRFNRDTFLKACNVDDY